ncbi:hypothetical protein [Thalassotalea hakodatensis]|uniref:hypothetical protein n=1 Tax=Thalassotalea hakodatensis TaxID=3030492 RepID=UPI0025735028|nr:hypothetical protein [Thalassotalea hakodatensis]
MSEKSQDKTKRKAINAITKYKPVYKLSFVIEDLLDDIEGDTEILVNQLPAIKNRISRRFNNGVVIFWIKSKYISKLGKAYPLINVFFQVKPNYKKVYEELCDLMHPVDIKIYTSNLTQEDNERWCKAVKKQKLHNLESVYNCNNLRRFAVRNINQDIYK